MRPPFQKTSARLFRASARKGLHHGPIEWKVAVRALMTPSLDEQVGPDGDTMIIEMRTYKTKPGKRSEFLAIFRSKSIPAHQEIGMKILGPFLSIENPDTFFFMRGFPDIQSREPMKARFYEGELWKRELEGLLMAMLDKYEVVVVEDTDDLVQWS